MTTKLRTLLAGAAIGAAALAASAGDAAAQYYKDKTVKIIVGLRAGGTVDTFARTFSKIWAKHIPGNPTMIVQNMTGAGSLRAQNYVFEVAEPDGLTIYWGPWDPVAQALGDPALRARYDKIAFLGGTGEVRVSYTVSNVLPGGKRMTRPEQIVDVGDGFKVGGSTATGIPTLLNLLSLNVLGVKYKYVGGYRGGSGVRAAQKRGEVQSYQTSISTFRRTGKDPLASGEWIGLYYLVPVAADGSYKHNKYIDEVPAFPDLYKKIHGKMPSGPQWQALNWMVNLVGEMTFMGFAPPGTPKEAVEALRASYAAAAADPAFVEPAMKRYRIPYTFVDVPTGERVLGTIENVDPKILETIKAVIDSAKS